MSLQVSPEARTVLYYSPERYEEYNIGAVVEHYNRTIRILGRWMREDLGSYFEIEYVYV